MPFDPAKTKKLYKNGISKGNKEIKKQTNSNDFDEWPILSSFGDLIGFIQIEKDNALPKEIWIRDKKYKITEKISKD